jgi:hypothetical protein
MLDMDRAAAVLLRLMRSKHRPLLEPKLPDIAAESAPKSVRQREVQFSDFERVAALKERWGLGKDTWENCVGFGGKIRRWLWPNRH